MKIATGQRKVVDVAIIGAGPYGLSLAAHLKESGIEFRIFGSAMRTWKTQMPKGMFLKSEGFASNLYDPTQSFTLECYCKEESITYSPVGHPVALSTFSSYGEAFQQRFVPQLEERTIAALECHSLGFELRTDADEIFFARRVIVAVGIGHFQYLPPKLADLPPGMLSHSSAHHLLDVFKGREVAVIGAGASAVDIAALLHKAGATTHLITRRPAIEFHKPPEPSPRPWLSRVRYPQSGLGLGWRSLLCTEMPLVFHALPERFRLEVVRSHLGPAACWFTRPEVEGKVAIHPRSTISQALIVGNRLNLMLEQGGGTARELLVDHVIAGTGYKVSIDRIAFLRAPLRSLINSADSAPVLSRNFETSIPGLYFIGAASANSFGPLTRFAYGAKFTARCLSRHLQLASHRLRCRTRSSVSFASS